MGALPEPWASLRARIESIESRLTHLLNRSPFFGTGMHPNGAGGIDSDTYVAGTAGYSFKNTGNFEVNNITLRGGIIGNDALTNPLSPLTLHADATNFAPTTAGVTIMSVTATVPSGYTKALLIGLYVSAFAHNSTAANDSLYANILTTPATAGWQIPSPTCPAGAWTSAYQQGTLLVTGLTGGGTVTISGQVSTSGANWAANASNVANLDVAVMFLR
jgi:hypothetical protein